MRSRDLIVSTHGREILGTYPITIASSSTGGDVGILIGISDQPVERIAGDSTAATGGVDTPIVDAMVGFEKFNQADGGVLNLNITVGAEASSGVAVGRDVTQNRTFTQEYWPIEKK